MFIKRVLNFGFCVILVLVHNVYPSQNNDENDGMKISKQKPIGGNHESSFPTINKHLLEEQCPMNVECSKLGFPCISCDYNDSCIYGAKVPVRCTALVDCSVPDDRKEGKEDVKKEFTREMICRYCYQTEHWEHNCVQKGINCNAVSSPRFYYKTNCTVRSDILCFGKRTFLKKLPCNWTGGHRWSTALALSVTLGGFGADRFYLGHWQEGIGKLFSFGGLGVWTLIDVVLIAIHYLGPADGSLYT